jgi:hypothetical protein
VTARLLRVAGSLAAGAWLLAVCGGAAAAPARPAGADRWGTVWLCRPGLTRNPCAADLTTTVVGRNGSIRVEHAAPARRPPVDCFYVYPTVSVQPTVNANVRVDPQERGAAVAQASRFSQDCRVYAPVYRQVTLRGLLTPGGITPGAALTAYASLRAAFADYLAHYNHGRGIVFVGHSQGASLLIALLRREVDGRPALRRRLVSALLLGGNVTVAKRGAKARGDFAHIPACRSATDTGCVVAYSTFASEPPPDALFGRVGQGLNPWARTQGAGLQVLCVNPAAPGGGAAPLDAYFPVASIGLRARVKTPWVAFPGAYTARCESAGGATWLQVSRLPGEKAPGVKRLGSIVSPAWGLHVADVNLALGDLVDLVRRQAAAYRRS